MVFAILCNTSFCLFFYVSFQNIKWGKIQLFNVFPYYPYILLMPYCEGVVDPITDCNDVFIYLSFNKYGYLFNCNGRGGGFSFGLVDFVPVRKSKRRNGIYTFSKARR